MSVRLFICHLLLALFLSSSPLLAMEDPQQQISAYDHLEKIFQALEDLSYNYRNSIKKGFLVTAVGVFGIPALGSGLIHVFEGCRFIHHGIQDEYCFSWVKKSLLKTIEILNAIHLFVLERDYSQENNIRAFLKELGAHNYYNFSYVVGIVAELDYSELNKYFSNLKWRRNKNDRSRWCLDYRNVLKKNGFKNIDFYKETIGVMTPLVHKKLGIGFVNAHSLFVLVNIKFDDFKLHDDIVSLILYLIVELNKADS